MLDGENIILADTPEGFSRAIIRLAEKEDVRRKLIVSARALVRRRYDWAKLGASLTGEYR